MSSKSNKSAKDLAFEKERQKYRKQLREYESLLKRKEVELSDVNEKLHDSENKCSELQEWIERLLEYTELSEEDMKRLIKKEKDTAEMMEHMSGIFGIMGMFSGRLYR